MKHKQLSRRDMERRIKECIKNSPELSSRAIGRIVGCHHATVSKYRNEMLDGSQIIHADTGVYDWVNHPYLLKNPSILDGLSIKGLCAIKRPGVLDKMQEKNLTSPVYASSLLNGEKLAVKGVAANPIKRSDVRIFVQDIRKGLPQVGDESVDLVLCDPPYGSKWLGLYENIGEVSARILKPHGNLVLMVGQSHLNKILPILDKYLRYNWTLAYITPSGSNMQQQRLVYPGHKSILWYVKGEIADMNCVFDVIKAPPRENDEGEHHQWEQSLGGFMKLVEMFSKEGEVVADICCGSGTTGVSAAKLGRKVVLCDIDSEAVRTAKRRIEEAFGGDKIS